VAGSFLGGSIPDLGAVPDDAVDGVAVRLHGPIAEVILSRPAVHNALDLAMWSRIDRVFKELGADQQIRVIIVCGAGGRAFSSGADISEFRAERLGTEAARNYNRRIAEALRAIRRAPQPVLAMIVGLAVGGGCEIATACDLRIASDDARLGIPIARLGVTLGMEEITGLVGLVGPGRAKDLLFTGRLIGAAEALQIGLVDRVVPRPEIEEAAWHLAEGIARAAPKAAIANKLAVGMVTYGSDDGDLEQLERLTDDVYAGRDLAEGVEAFIAKRDPSFRGD
jgi:enoyl-CoA hydratase